MSESRNGAPTPRVDVSGVRRSPVAVGGAVPTCVDMADGERADTPEAGRDGGRALAGATRPRRVLIVEDAEDLREIYAMWLRERGYEVFEAGDGRTAWDRIAELQPDVVLLDLGLPSVDGWKLATLLRLDRRRRAPAVIAITGLVEPDAIQDARDAGVDAVLFKPCDADAIVAAIETEATRLLESS